jgi:hypothetical protein
MPVAKSYQELEIVGDVFVSSGRQYVNVKLKSGKLKTVRWYSDAEYRKMYPEVVAVARSTDPASKSQKEVLGFTKGYITIFKGDTYAEIDWLRASIARYTRWWGWYIISTEEVPADLPEGITPIRLPWELVGQEDGNLKPEHLVKEAVESIIYDESESEFQGAIGERLDLYLTVERTIELDGSYGRSTMHIMRDDSGNLFVWTTASKSWSAGTEHHIKGTVKDHRKYKNECQTVLTRCLEVK